MHYLLQAGSTLYIHMLLPIKTNVTILHDSRFFFLLDSGASISVLNHPTYITIANLLGIKQNNPPNSSKTLTVANQTEVPFYIISPLP